MHCWVLWLAFLLSSQCAIASTPVNAEQWLEAMENALKTRSFQGTLVYAGSNRVNTLKIFHSVIDGDVYEHIISQGEPIREVIRDRSKVFCFIQEQQRGRESAVMSSKNWLGLPPKLTYSNRNYSLLLGKQQAVMERPAQIVIIQPKDKFRYLRKIWVDRESMIPIKTQVVDSTGRVLEQLMFSKLSITQSIPRTQFQLPTDSKSYQWAVQKTELIPQHQQQWHITNNPTGFEVVKYTRYQSHANSEQMTHILLSDGVTLVSIYVDLQAEAISETYTIGAINLGTTTSSGYRITVLGEVPGQTIQSILGGMQLIQ
ncbi:MAG: MucB/RseB C-terminal domain-containing protein [Methylococcales bacterium]